MIFRTKKDIAAFVATAPEVVKTRGYYGEGNDYFKEIEAELVKLIAVGEGSPDFGEDWKTWLDANLDVLLEEAISIAM